MPAKRSAMRKIREVLRLKFEARLSHERIAAATGLSKGAVGKYSVVQASCLETAGHPSTSADLADARFPGDSPPQSTTA